MDPLLPGDPRNIGPYRLEGRLGAGGMGQVFLGWSPGARRVAVKVIRSEHAGNPKFQARFVREVEAARRVGGFHTAQVVDADPQADPPWLVTAFVEGPSLQQMVEAGQPLAPDAVRRLGAGLAEGVAAIHRSGLVHRDLKPGNIIMSADGPRIIDFGIAQDAEATALTATGTVIGTYAFMSPEQVLADRAGPASDVFALGCVLAYAATGHGPFDAPTIPAIVHRIINEPPRLDGAPGDLQPIIAACLAKDPAGRPAVADLLTWFTTAGTGPKTVPAAPPRQPSSSGMSRRTLLLGAGAVAGVAAVAVTAAVFWSRTNASPAWPTAMVFSRDGRTLIAVDGENADRVWRCEVATGSTAVTRLDVTGKVGSARLSPDGATLVRTEGSTIRHWSVAAGSSVTLKGHTEFIQAVAFNRDGTNLASIADDNTVRIWDLTTGNTTATYRNKDSDDPRALAFSPDGTTLAVGSLDGNNVRLVDPRSGRLKATREESNHVLTVNFSPDGRTLAIGGDGTRLWNLDPDSPTRSLSDQADSGVHALFGPDGRILAGGSSKHLAENESGGTGVRIWDVASSRIVRTLAAAAPPLAFSPDGRTLASGEDKIRLWDVTTGALVRTV